MDWPTWVVLVTKSWCSYFYLRNVSYFFALLSFYPFYSSKSMNVVIDNWYICFNETLLWSWTVDDLVLKVVCQWSLDWKVCCLRCSLSVSRNLDHPQTSTSLHHCLRFASVNRYPATLAPALIYDLVLKIFKNIIYWKKLRCVLTLFQLLNTLFFFFCVYHLVWK